MLKFYYEAGKYTLDKEGLKLIQSIKDVLMSERVAEEAELNWYKDQLLEITVCNRPFRLIDRSGKYYEIHYDLVLKPRFTRQLLNGVDVVLTLPQKIVKQLYKMVADVHGVDLRTINDEIVSTHLVYLEIENLPSEYNEVVSKLLFAIRNYRYWVTQKALAATRKKLQETIADQTIVCKEFIATKLETLHIPHEVKHVFTRRQDDDLSSSDFYYDQETNEFHYSFNTDLVVNGTNEYRTRVTRYLSKTCIKMLAKILNMNTGKIRDGVILVPINNRIGKSHVVYGKTFYQSNSNLITSRGDIINITNPAGVEVYAAGYMNETLIEEIKKLRNHIRSFNVDTFETINPTSFKCSACNSAAEAYFGYTGQCGYMRPRVTPAYEDLDYYDSIDSGVTPDLDSIVDKYYSFSNLLDDNDKEV